MCKALRGPQEGLREDGYDHNPTAPIRRVSNISRWQKKKKPKSLDFQTRRPWKSFTFKQRAEQGREINTDATRQTEKCQHLKEAAREPRASAGSADSTNGCDGFAFHGGCGEPPAPFLLSHVHIQVPLSPSPPVPSSVPPKMGSLPSAMGSELGPNLDSSQSKQIPTNTQLRNKTPRSRYS